MCTYAAKVEVVAGTDGRKESRLVEGRRREGSHEQNVCGAARLRPEVAALLSAIEPWDMEASLPLAAPPPPSSAIRGSLPVKVEDDDDDDDDTVHVASLLEPRDVWGTVREAIVAREKEACARELLAGDHGEDDPHEEEEKRRERVVRVVETSVTRMEYPETRYRVVYVPLYLVRYTQGDPQGEPREFFFAINALTGTHHATSSFARFPTLPVGIVAADRQPLLLHWCPRAGKSHGQRPFGVGKILGRGLSFLEVRWACCASAAAGGGGWWLVVVFPHQLWTDQRRCCCGDRSVQGLLGLKDHHTAQIVIGSQLSQLDRRICYADKGKTAPPHPHRDACELFCLVQLWRQLTPRAAGYLLLGHGVGGAVVVTTCRLLPHLAGVPLVRVDPRHRVHHPAQLLGHPPHCSLVSNARVQGHHRPVRTHARTHSWPTPHAVGSPSPPPMVQSTPPGMCYGRVRRRASTTAGSGASASRWPVMTTKPGKPPLLPPPSPAPPRSSFPPRRSRRQYRPTDRCDGRK